jgi:hypothetical protein
MVNCLPMATVCSEARAQAADICRPQVKLMSLWYDAAAPSDTGYEILERVSVQPTTVMVTTSNEIGKGYTGFNSAEHLVDVVNRVFSSGVERIIWNAWFNSGNSFEDLYWPHTAQTRELNDM